MQRVTRQEWVWVMAVAALVMAISSVPYLAGYLAQTADIRFAGAVLDRADYHSHLAKMRQGYSGEWSYRLLFTPETHAGAYLQTFYVALGHLARLTGLGLSLTYQAARLLCGFLMLLAIYGFVALFVEPVRTRRVAFFLATLASGLGWLTEIIHPTPAGGISPMDFWLLDGSTYLSALTFPHFSAAIGLLVTIPWLLLRRPEGPGWHEVGLAVLASLALGFIHPYGLLLADLLPLLYWGIEALRTRRVVWRGLMAVAVMGIAQAPLVAYDLWVFRTQPIFAGWADQNLTLSPPPEIYLWGYGALLGLGAVGVATRMRRSDKAIIFPLLWIGLVAVLVYLPWNLQRRFLEGIQVPLGLLAGVGLAEGLLPQTPQVEGDRPARWRWSTLALALALMAMSNLYMTTGLTMAAAMRPPALFWDAGLLAGVDWLGQNTTWDATVLSSFEVGSLIPARIGHRVVLGHGIETKDPEEKQRATARFFAAATSDDERRGLLARYGIAYVFYGPFERELGDFDPAQASYLTQVYTNRNVSIYRVTPPK
jgi:energy-converting hydrogenase Eha subunit C